MSRSRALAECAAVTAWSILVPAAFFAVATPLGLDAWTLIAGQAAAVAVQALPLLVLRPPLLLGWTARRAVVVTVLLAVGTVTGAVLQPVGLPTHLRGAAASVLSGVGEEAVYRGLVTDRLQRAGLPLGARIPLNAALFAAGHVPVAVLHHDLPAGLVLPFVFGLLFAALREGTRGLLLPVAVHIAVDLTGS